jgi:L-2-hydroxyglutarate oxidase LhgO
VERVDCVVIGAGVIGLAIARQLAMSGREVLVLEAAGMIGTETSSRNSEVIHAGIVLSDRIAQGPHLRRRQAEAVRVLCRARNPASPLRQVDRGG